MNDQQRLRQLLHAEHTCISICTFEEGYALELVRDAALSLARDLWIWSSDGGVRGGLLAEDTAQPKTELAKDALKHLARKDRRPICVMLDLAAHLGHAPTLRALRNLLLRFENSGGQLVLIDHDDGLPDVVKAYATPLEISFPDERELEQLLRATLRNKNREHPIEIAISRSHLDAIVRNLRGLTRRQAERIVADMVADDRRFDDDDITRVLAGKRRILQADGLLAFVETPVDLSEIGGLKRLKAWLAQRDGALSDEGRAFGLRPPRGVLMLGVQGAGKSLCAKAIAAAWQRPLLRLDAGALYDRYVGESERRLRDALRQAEMMAPNVLWIDEIEKAFASAAAQSTDGGLSKRMFGSLLTWMQEHEQSVFLVATANDIEALPPELLRKGRFDEIFFVDLPEEPVRREIFAIHLRKRERDPGDFDLDALAHASEGFSGAEIEQAVISGLHTAFANHEKLLTSHLLDAVRGSPPLSVTMGERVAALQKWARRRCVPAD